MALNKQIYFPNPQRTRIFGLNDDVREDGYAYSTLVTILSTETCKIKDGAFAINYLTGASACYISCILTIGTNRFTLYEQYVAASTRGYSRFTLNDLNLADITLKTADTVKIEFVYTTGTATPPTGKIKASIIVEDYTA